MIWKKGGGNDGPRPDVSEGVGQLIKSSHHERETSAQEAVVPAFHWKQLDAADFPTFIKNLRAVGCPEATIRDIIQGELAEIYTVKRQEAGSQLATAPEFAREALHERLQKLAKEETALLASLTGSTGVANLSGTEAVSVPPESHNPTREGSPTASIEDSEGRGQQDGSVLTPAAFLVGNDPNQAGGTNELSVRPTDPALDAATAQIIANIRDEFALSLAGAGDDPSSPFYEQRWLAAQRQNDEIFSSLYGGDGFLRAQSEAAQKQARENAR